MRGGGVRTYRPEIWFMQQAYGLIVPRVVGRISDLIPSGSEIIAVHVCATADDKAKNVSAIVQLFLTSDPNLPLADVNAADAVIDFTGDPVRNALRIYGGNYIAMWPMRRLILGSEVRLGITLRFLGLDPMTLHAGILYREP